MPDSVISKKRIVSIDIYATDYDEVVRRTIRWAVNGESRTVFAACVNSVMEAHDSPTIGKVFSGADLVTADGMPLVLGLRLLGVRDARRVYGPDLFVRVLKEAERLQLPIGLYGTAPGTLHLLLATIRRQWPALEVVFAEAPPFRLPTESEDRSTIAAIRDAKPRLLFVGTGCPKQEQWIADHRRSLPCVMLGVGAAFDFLAGTKLQAPRWIMRIGLEWLFRLATEPRRLWKRYLKHNPRFVFLFALQLLGWNAQDGSSRDLKS